MKKFLLTLIICFICGASANAEIEAPELEFHPAGGGKFIYCNNPEAIDAHTIMNGDDPRYVMNNNALGPGKYYIYLSHYNFIGMKIGIGEAVSKDMELDVELTPVNGSCEYTLSNIGFETADLYSYYNDTGKIVKREPSWGLLNCCAEAMEKNIIDLDGDRYYPYDGKNEKYEIKSCDTKWLSEYIPNYSVVHYRKPVHIQAVLEIASGYMNVNVCAFEAGDELRDRSSMPETAQNGIVRYDRTIKGIADTLPQVRASLEYTIDDSTEDGTYLPVTMHNRYAPDGIVNYDWITHISALDDPWAKSLADESGMLAFTYKDESKLTYYGKKAANKTDIWYFDTHHTDTHKYENQPAAKSAEYYEPNYEITAQDSVNGYATNLGNYGVTYTYELKIRNNGTSVRYFVYEPTTQSNILVYTNLNGVESDYAFVKNSNHQYESDTMSVVELPAGKMTEFSVNVVLPVNFNGGIRNAFRIYDSAEKLDFDTVYAKHREHESVSPINGKYLSEYKDKLPKATYDAFYGTFDDYEVIDCGAFYAVRWCIWDTMTSNSAWWLVNHIYILDDDFNITGSYTHKSLPVGMSCSGGRLYVQTAWDGIYSTGDGREYVIETVTELPPNEEVYRPKTITMEELLDSKGSPHTVSLGNIETVLTEREYDILKRAVGDISLRSVEKYRSGSTGMPHISIDGYPATGPMEYDNDYFFISSDDANIGKLLNYYLYFGENAQGNELNISDWAYADFKTAMEYGFVDPRTITYGTPEDVTEGITRIHFCLLAKNMLNDLAPIFWPESIEGIYSDISNPDDIRLAEQMSYHGIITGYEDGTFRPYNTITRQEAAVILSRMLGLFEMDARAEISFMDDAQIQNWAREGLANSIAYGIMNGVGDGLFEPEGIYTIEQSVVTMLREFNAVTDAGYFMIPAINTAEIQQDATNYIVYREGYRNGRIELCAYESEADSEVINDNGIVSVSGRYGNDRKYYLCDGKWIWFESGYSNISNNASVIFASGRY